MNSGSEVLMVSFGLQQIMKDRWINAGFEEDELKPYTEPELDITDQKRIGGKDSESCTAETNRPSAVHDVQLCSFCPEGRTAVTVLERLYVRLRSSRSRAEPRG